ncbi:MAG: protein kinase [Polyangiaceae bacterium]|nr:protein kinase [Polyangiaceae bacterium]
MQGGVASTSSGRPVDDALIEPAPASSPDYREGGIVAEKYRLIRKVGEGGMGTVWVAHNEALDVPVAIKFIRAGKDANRHVNRLTQEARAAAKIGHPAILRVFDFGKTSAGDPFIVMELLHGEDLAAVLDRRGSLPERRAVQILLPVLHALVAAHAKGIIHRDLKPDNIFLAESDAGRIQPKLVDFGVAKLNVRGFERLTQSGAVLGSPAYMSPEQARGKDVDQAADIWAACVVLYEMVTGALPFEGDNYNALLWAILHDEPTPTSTHGGGDPRLWRMIQKGLVKDPRGRWGSMLELGRELAAWVFEQGLFVDITGSSLQSTWLQRVEPGGDDPDAFLRSSRPAKDDPRNTVSASKPPGELLRSLTTVPDQLERAASKSAGHRSLLSIAIASTAMLLGLVAFVVQSESPGPASGDSAKAEVSALPLDAPPQDARSRSGSVPGNPLGSPASLATAAPKTSATPPLTSAAPTGSRIAAPPPAANAPRPPRRLKNPFER